jgi:thiol-disulfide isomerase/thioredoxin
MKSKKATLILFLYILSNSSPARADAKDVNSLRPEVGKPCPAFTLTDVTHYPKEKVTLADFKGKWLFLDFWFTGCTLCIKSFPKVSALQNMFADRIQFLLVGMNDKKYNGNAKELFEKLRKKQGLNIAAAYDSNLVNLWNIHSMPHIIIVDPEGIVRHITGGRDMTPEKITDLLAGKVVTFYPKDIDRPVFNPGALATGDATLKEAVLFQSVLTRWTGERQNGGIGLDQFPHNDIEFLQKGWSVSMVPLIALYNYAYIGRWTWTWRDPDFYGKFYLSPILQLADSSSFNFDFKSGQGRGLFNYSLTISPGNVTQLNMMKAMQENLKTVFGYEVSLETREMPVWRLSAKTEALKQLLTKGGNPDNGIGTPTTGYKSIAAGFTIRNQPISILLHNVTSIVSETDFRPFLDDTGIKANIDITIAADLTDFEDIQRALRKNGLEFKLGTKKMTVLVIKDDPHKLK